MNKAILSCTAAACFATGYLLLAGPLDPPSGPVASTFKTLTEVEPRIAITETNTPGDADSLFRITQPGSYYLTGNVTGVEGKHGIEIAAGNVSIDLGGFSLLGVPGSGSLRGITTDGLRSHLIIRNGTVTNWGSDGINLNAGGIGANILIEQIVAAANGGYGMLAGNNVAVRGCVARVNGEAGIHCNSNSTIVNCSSWLNTGDGIRAGNGASVADCTAGDNGGTGIQAGLASAIANCSVLRSGNFGIYASSGSSVTGCAVRESFSDGINASGSVITDCSVIGSVNDGIDGGTGSTISGCTVVGCGGDGIDVNLACTVRENTCRGNGTGDGIGAGIYASQHDSRIEGNACTDNEVGIHVDGVGNIIVRNTCSGNDVNFDFFGSNRFGTIVDITLQGPAPVYGDAAASTLTTTDPWANFAH